jgi:hypothetical protein
MGNRITKALFFACAVSFLFPLRGFPQADVEAARKILSENKDSVIQVRLVTKWKVIYMGREMVNREQENEVTGVVLHPSGLTVVSRLAGNPMEMLSLFGMPGVSDSDETKFETSFGDIKLILPDGKELPAKVALQDQDLDLLFLRPEKTDISFQPLSVKKAPEPGLLDEVVTIGRLGNLLNRQLYVDLDRIASVIKKPRPYYVTNRSGMGVGNPVFNLSGATLGIQMFRRPAKGQVSGMQSLLSTGGFLTVVVPMEDIMATAAQALEAKEEAPAETGAETKETAPKEGEAKEPQK